MSLIASLLQTSHTFAVMGASQDPSKYGNELLQAPRVHGHNAMPVNPKYKAIDGQPSYCSLADLPNIPDVVVTAAPALVSAQIAEACSVIEIPYFWMPPGTESDAALEFCRKNNVAAIHGFYPVFMLKLPQECWYELP
jgi:hypothetical protein